MNGPYLQVVCEPAELAESLQRAVSSDGRPIVVDIREEGAYRAGHVKGAVWLDLAEWVAAARSRDGGLEHATAWYDRIGKLGIQPADRVIVYDDGKMMEAARVWFILQHFGVERAAVLNGGYPAMESRLSRSLIAEGGPQPPHEAVAFRPPAGAKGLVGLADKGAVSRSLEARDARILDARTPAEYSGAERLNNPRAGHLPGAINLSHEQLLEADGRLKSPGELRRLFESAGLKRGERIIAHCQGGGRAALAALAVVYAGYGPVANYYLSFGEWAADEQCPLAGPTSKPPE